MRLKIFMLCLVALFVSQTSRAQWVVDRPRQPRTRHHQCHEEHRAYILYGKYDDSELPGDSKDL